MTPPGPVTVHWHADTERLEGTVSHALLVVPEGPNAHRVYFVARTPADLGKMAGTVLSMVMEAGGLEATRAMLAVLENPPGEVRGTPVLRPPPP